MAVLKAYCDASFCPNKKIFKFASVFCVDGVKVYEYESPIMESRYVQHINYAETLAALHCLKTIAENKKELKYFGINTVFVYNDNSHVFQNIENLKMDDVIGKVKMLVNKVMIFKAARNNKHIKRCDFLASVVR